MYQTSWLSILVVSTGDAPVRRLRIPINREIQRRALFILRELRYHFYMEVRFFDEKIEQFINSLEKPTIAKVLRTIDLLKRYGHQLGMPHSKKIDHWLFELRVRGRQEVRIIYIFRGENFVLLYGFVKKSQKIVNKELGTARQKLRALDTI